jgi:hypothetical protein
MLEVKELSSRPEPEVIVQEYEERGKRITTMDFVPLKGGNWMVFIFISEQIR